VLAARSGNGGANTKMTKKRSKFHLDSDDESDGGDVYMGFTHRGHKLGDFEDDFKERVAYSSDEEADPDKGKLGEDYVNRMNFGGGEENGEYEQDEGYTQKKSRKEVFEEIIEKSKAFNQAKKEMKQVNEELREELDDEYQDLIGLLDFKRNKREDKVLPKEDKTKEKSYDELA